MAFTVKTRAFEGPLDLLLDLVEKRKLFINDVSLAQVTDDFIGHVKGLDELPMGESAHFILVASTLLLLKSKSLLPGLELSAEEQGDIRDLEARLKVYRRIQEASRHVRLAFGREIIFPPARARLSAAVFAPDPRLSLARAVETMRDLLKRLPQTEVLPKTTVRKVISLEEMINDLAARVQSQLKISFGQFTAGRKKEKVEIIVGFLAVLELVRRGLLQVSQETRFGEITLETKDVGVPKY